MKDELLKSICKFYHDMAIVELRCQNSVEGREKLTYNDILYLDIISAHSGEYTATQIADMLYVSRPAVTSKISDLVKRGYVKRVQDKKDKRIYYLHISDSVYWNKSLENAATEVLEKFSESYGEEELSWFCGSLNHLGHEILRHDEKK